MKRSKLWGIGLAYISFGLIGCMTSPETVEEVKYTKITISSLNFVECADTAMKVNRDNPETRPYFDVDLKISKKMNSVGSSQCSIHFGKNVEKFHIRVVSDFGLFSWESQNISMYDSLVTVGRIGETPILSYARGSSDFRSFKDLKSKQKIFMGNNDENDYFDKDSKSFVLWGRNPWLGYLEIYVEE